MSSQIGPTISHNSKYNSAGIPSIPGERPLLVNLTAVCSSFNVKGASRSFDSSSDSEGKFKLSKNYSNNSWENWTSEEYRFSKNYLNVLLSAVLVTSPFTGQFIEGMLNLFSCCFNVNARRLLGLLLSE